LVLNKTSTREVQNGIGVSGVIFEQPDSLRGGAKDQLDASPLCLGDHLIHDGEPARHAGADHQTLALPGDVFPDRQRGVTKLLPKATRTLLAPLSQFAPVKDHILGVFFTVNFERTETAFSPFHGLFSPLRNVTVSVEPRNICYDATGEIATIHDLSDKQDSHFRRNVLTADPSGKSAWFSAIN
jgi:hypothetical protein